MSADLTQFVGKLYKAGEGMQGAAREGVTAASLAAKKTFEAGAKAVRTPKVINTARGRRGNAYRVKYLWFTSKPKPETVTFFWGAPPYWRERGTEDHDIKPRRQALYFRDEYSTGTHVSGVAARPFWQATKETAMRQATPIMHKAELAALVKAGYR